MYRGNEWYDFLFFDVRADRYREYELKVRRNRARGRVSRVGTGIGWIGGSLTRAENGIGSRR